MSVSSIPSSTRRTTRFVQRLGVTMLVAGSVAAFGATSATAAPVVNISGGTTALKLDAGTAKALGGLGVAVHRVGTARKLDGGFAFPVTGGVVDPASAAGVINHSGGILFRKGSTTVKLTNFRITTKGTITMDARVNGGKAFVGVLVPDLSAAKITRPGIGTRVSNVKIKLSATGAAALRDAFDSAAFTKGLLIGTATVAFNPREVSFSGGATELAIPSATVGVLTSLGVTPAPAGTASVTSGGAFSFPITSGRVAVKTLAGRINHSGGISLTKGSTVVTLSDYRIDTVKGQLWGKVNGSAPVALFTLNLKSPTVTVTNRKVTVGNVGATLTAGAAAALNGAFGVTAFAEGIDFGKATVKGSVA